MIILVSALLILTIVLTLAVIGLLRSHAAILSELARLSTDRSSDSKASTLDPSLPHPRDIGPTDAANVVGIDLRGGTVAISVSASDKTLLAFLSSGCLTCQTFWAALSDPHRRGDLPTGARLVIVTKDTSMESPAKLNELAPNGIPLVMSSAAWTDYQIPHSPYFVYVDRSGHIRGEGTAQAWEQVLSLFTDALFDEEAAAKQRDDDEETAPRLPGDFGEKSTSLVPARGSVEEAIQADEALRAAGIGPGHPSLYEP